MAPLGVGREAAGTRWPGSRSLFQSRSIIPAGSSSLGPPAAKALSLREAPRVLRRWSCEPLAHRQPLRAHGVEEAGPNPQV